MDNNTILVLANPTDHQLAMLQELPAETSLAVGKSVEAFEKTASAADVIFNWGGGRQLLREVFAMSPNVRWVHSKAAGLDNLLFPELIESPVPLTNGRGVFSQSLGEFVLAAVLYFAKDFRRIPYRQAGLRRQFPQHRQLGVCGVCQHQYCVIVHGEKLPHV